MIPAIAASSPSLTLVLSLSAANLLALLGIAVKIWTSSRGLTLRGQPIEIRATAPTVIVEDCRDHRRKNETDHSNLFFRMSAAEQRIAATEATIAEIKGHYQSIDEKLTALLRRDLSPRTPMDPHGTHPA